MIKITSTLTDEKSNSIFVKETEAINLLLSSAEYVDTEEDRLKSSSRKKQGRKCKKIESPVKHNVAKMWQNRRPAYVSKKIYLQNKKMLQPCGKTCRFKCDSKFTEEERKSIFEKFWALGKPELQWNYISNCTTLVNPKYRYVREGGKSRRPNNAFYFRMKDKNIRVCKYFFRTTLGISESPIQTALEKKLKGVTFKDNRGGSRYSLE